VRVAVELATAKAQQKAAKDKATAKKAAKQASKATAAEAAARKAADAPALAKASSAAAAIAASYARVEATPPVEGPVAALATVASGLQDRLKAAEAEKKELQAKLSKAESKATERAQWTEVEVAELFTLRFNDKYAPLAFGGSRRQPGPSRSSGRRSQRRSRPRRFSKRRFR
jgi:membrane protein involved in colicin uptake